MSQEVVRRLLNVKEAAEYLGLSPRTLYNMSGPKSKKSFPVKPKRIGKLLKWDLRELETFIDSL